MFVSHLCVHFSLSFRGQLQFHLAVAAVGGNGGIDAALFALFLFPVILTLKCIKPDTLRYFCCCCCYVRYELHLRLLNEMAQEMCGISEKSKEEVNSKKQKEKS